MAVGVEPRGDDAGSHASALDELLLAIDVGGTKLAAGIVDGRGALVASQQRPTRVGAAAEELYADVLELVTSVSAGAGPLRACGVGCGGPMEPGGTTVSPLNIPGWRAFPLRRRLEDDLGLPVAIDNDAKALALAEHWVGAAVGCDHFMAMVVSTGVGGGVVLDGQLLHGRLANAGHVGHVIVEPDGAQCACGARGCLEAEISGRSIERRTGRPAQEAPDAERRRAGMLLGRGIASVVNLLDLDLVLVGGSVALGFGQVLFEAANRELEARSRLDFARGARIAPVGLGHDAPLIGAAGVARIARNPVETAA